MRQRIFAASGIFALVALGVAIGILWPYAEVWLRGGAPQATATLRADPDCNPVGIQCAAGSGSKTIKLRLEPGLRPLKRFRVAVEIVDTNAHKIDSVDVRFSMIGMNMGINQFRLDKTADNTWAGLAILPVCSTGRMDWLVNVEVRQRREAYAAEFAMTVVR